MEVHNIRLRFLLRKYILLQHLIVCRTYDILGPEYLAHLVVIPLNSIGYLQPPRARTLEHRNEQECPIEPPGNLLQLVLALQDILLLRLQVLLLLLVNKPIGLKAMGQCVGARLIYDDFFVTLKGVLGILWLVVEEVTEVELDRKAVGMLHSHIVKRVLVDADDVQHAIDLLVKHLGVCVCLLFVSVVDGCHYGLDGLDQGLWRVADQGWVQDRVLDADHFVCVGRVAYDDVINFRKNSFSQFKLIVQSIGPI